MSQHGWPRKNNTLHEVQTLLIKRGISMSRFVVPVYISFVIIFTFFSYKWFSPSFVPPIISLVPETSCSATINIVKLFTLTGGIHQ